MSKIDARARALNLFASRLSDTYLAFGGLYGNVILADDLRKKDPKNRDLKKLLVGANKEGMIEWDKAKEELWPIWFEHLREQSINALRIFPHRKNKGEPLDLCGKINESLLELMQRYVAAAKPYGIHFSLVLMPDPVYTGYLKKSDLKRWVLPHYKKSELSKLSAEQKRFLVKQKMVSLAEYFTDPDVWACQRLYLDALLEWVKKEDQIFALEVANEAGWWDDSFHWDKEEAIEAWVSRVVDYVHKKRLKIPVGVSHPGYGILGYEPVRWSRETSVDFYSPHLYCGMGGAKRGLDFGLVSDLVMNYCSIVKPAFMSEWGFLSPKIDERLQQLALRDATWFSLLNGSPGLFQQNSSPHHKAEFTQARNILEPLKLNKKARRQPLVGVDINKSIHALDSNDLYKDAKATPQKLGENKARSEAYWELQRCTEFFLNHGIAFDFTLDPEEYEISLDPGEYQNIHVPASKCLFAFSPEYQCKYAAFGEWEIIVAYFRNVEPVVTQGYNLRSQSPRPFQAAWQLPKRPRGAKGGPWHYRLTVYNLDTGEEKQGRVARDSSVDFGNAATDDFVFVFQR